MFYLVRVPPAAFFLMVPFLAAWAGSFAPIRFLERQAPLTNAPVKPASDMVSALQKDELVLGVSLNGEARAYPLNTITRPPREIINDTLGDTPIAVTWCSRCHHGVVFARTVKDKTLTFGIEGNLWLNNMVMYDVETDSQWAQFTGEAQSGPLAGAELERIPCIISDWQTWKAQHPDSTVVALDKVTSRYVTKLQQQRGKYVLGYNVDEQARGYPFDVLKERQVLNDQIGNEPMVVTFDPDSTTAMMFSRRVDEEVLQFHGAPDGRMADESKSLWDRISGKCLSGKFKGKSLRALPAQVALQMTWLRFHPGSHIQGFR